MRLCSNYEIGASLIKFFRLGCMKNWIFVLKSILWAKLTSIVQVRDKAGRGATQMD